MVHSERIDTNDAGIVAVIQRDGISGRADYLIELVGRHTPELDRDLHGFSTEDGSSSGFEKRPFPAAAETDGAAGA